jgi:error-prone DNA polymerase
VPADPFVHLHVASGYSLRHGASHPHVLVERAAEHGMDTLALTDRDGVYGAVRFAKACARVGITPVLGVDLALTTTTPTPQPGRKGPARGGAFLDESHQRVVLLAEDNQGWAALCRLLSAVHLGGERGTPVATLEQVAAAAGGGGLVVLLGPRSDVAAAVARRRPDVARALLRRWQAAVPRENLVAEVVSHRAAGEAAAAGRWLGFADESGLPAVLTNSVRYADRTDAPVADVLDAARRLVPLDARHVDRRTAEGYLKSGKEMALVAEEVVGPDPAGDRARALLARTRALAERCSVDLGLGEVHFPDLAVPGGRDPDAHLRDRALAGIRRRGMREDRPTLDRLDAELATIHALGYATYFLTVGDVVDLIRSLGIRCAARGSGAGSLVNYALGVSDVDPVEHRLLMERFLSPLRRELPDVDVDVESARRLEVYDAILDRYGTERCACLCMVDTYRVRHAIRDVGAALGMPPGEIDAIAKSFPHVRAAHVHHALRDLPELRASGLSEARLDLMFRLVAKLDGLPRHLALHPCGVLLSDTTLLDRTPVERSYLGYPMSQFDKDDVEDLGLLKLDVLGIRMQSAIAHAVAEVARVDGVAVDVDTAPRDDPATFALIRSTRTLGCFQIESPGQRELVGKFAPETFADLIIDISLFRPGPVKSDMITPFLEARQGWRPMQVVHPSLTDVLAETYGVVVFHEQVLRLVSIVSGCTLAEADEVRRSMSDPDCVDEIRVWFCGAALDRGYSAEDTARIWEILAAFASFGFCKAHAAAFALPTYQSAWLKAHHPAAFLAGVLTHDPGMYPKRLILDDARQLGIAVLPLDVNRSAKDYTVERVGVLDEPPPGILGAPPRAAPADAAVPDARGYGIRLGLADVKGISDPEVASLLAGRPYGSLSDFWHRAGCSRPVVERLVVAGGFDELYGLTSTLPGRRRGRVTRRDLLLQVAELDAWSRSVARGAARTRVRRSVADGPPPGVQLALELGDDPGEVTPTGLPEMTDGERVRAELEVLGLDVSHHVMDFHEPLLAGLGVTRARDLLGVRNRAQVLVAGVKVATQTPPIRSGRRVIFLTLDDGTGPIDAAFFEDAQVGYASTLFHSWLLVLRATVRRTGPRGISLNADACWELAALRAAWDRGGLPAVQEVMAGPGVLSEASVHGAAGSRASRPVMTRPPAGASGGAAAAGVDEATRRRLGRYADLQPAGEYAKTAPRRLWHSSAGSAG